MIDYNAMKLLPVTNEKELAHTIEAYENIPEMFRFIDILSGDAHKIRRSSPSHTSYILGNTHSKPAGYAEVYQYRTIEELVEKSTLFKKEKHITAEDVKEYELFEAYDGRPIKELWVEPFYCAESVDDLTGSLGMDLDDMYEDIFFRTGSLPNPLNPKEERKYQIMPADHFITDAMIRKIVENDKAVFMTSLPNEFSKYYDFQLVYESNNFEEVIEFNGTDEDLFIRFK